MKRSGFKRKASSAMKRSGFKRKTGGARMKRTAIRPKLTEWDIWRPDLKVQFELAGITRCEVRFDGCFDKNFLTFAHVDKRRYLTRLELFIGVALACQPCHDIVEQWKRARMRAFIEQIIAKRGWQPLPPHGLVVTAPALSTVKPERGVRTRVLPYSDDEMPF